MPGCISLELEKDRPQIEALMPYADLILFSRALAEARGYSDVPSLLAAMHALAPHAELTCAWGAAGAWAVGRDHVLHHCPALMPDKVVDTLGAGDVFNAGMIAAMTGGADLPSALTQATRLAGRKVGQQGLDGLHLDDPA